jgi:hypothetical protein
MSNFLDDFTPEQLAAWHQAEAEAAADRKRELQRAMAANDWAWKGKTPRVVYDLNGNGNAMVYSGKERIL